MTARQYACQVCRRPLNRYLDTTGQVSYRHPAHLPVDHAPVPQRADQITGVIRCCDYCCIEGANAWLYTTKGAELHSVQHAAEFGRSRKRCPTTVLPNPFRVNALERITPERGPSLPHRCCVCCIVVEARALAGSAGLMLVEGISYLDPETSVFGAMLDGWQNQQLARCLKDRTIAQRLGVLRRFAEFTNAYPWQWRCADAEDFIASMRSGRTPIAISTARSYEMALQMFMQYATDPRYGWGSECMRRFGSAPAQILHEFNTVRHVTEFEGQPHRRPLTYDEVQALFDAADGLAEDARARHRKGVLTAMRNAAFLKTVYAFGLRRREAVGLDLADLRHNPDAAAYGRVGALYVRWGKASGGGTPKRRTVLTVPEMDWIVPAVEHWLTEIRPLFEAGAHPALWVTERADRLSRRAANEAFTTVRDAAGIDDRLELHCLRHSYVTHLIEFGYPEKFVQDQVGHAYASTLAIYSHVSDQFRNALLKRALAKRNSHLWENQ